MLLQTCVGKIIDIPTNIERLHVFLEQKLGVKQLSDMVVDVKHAVVNGDFSELSQRLTGEKAVYVPLCVQLVQLENVMVLTM